MSQADDDCGLPENSIMDEWEEIDREDYQDDDDDEPTVTFQDEENP